MRAGLLSLVLLTMFAGGADAAMVIDTRYQELWARVSTQRWYANPVYQSTRYGQQDQDSVELVRTDERDQRVSAHAERNTFVAADSIFLTGSADMLATHGEPLAGEALCWCLTESWVRNKSEFTFTVDQRSSFSLDWTLTDFAAAAGAGTEVELILTGSSAGTPPLHIQHSALGNFNALGILEAGTYSLFATVWSGTDAGWQTAAPGSSVSAGSTFTLSFQTAPAPVPLPAALWLLLSGLAGLATVRVTR